MGGFDEQVAIMGEWMPPSPSPRSLFSSVISDCSVAYSGCENTQGAPLYPGTEGLQNAARNDATSVEGYEASDSNALAQPKIGSRGCLRERMAARAGFNAPRLNTETIRTNADLSKNPEVRSPYLTIPPGLSPTCLLDSPVFLANSLVVPSPTTGKFPFAPGVNNQNSTFVTGDPDKGKENAFDDASSFAFMPISESQLNTQFNAANIVHSSGLAQQSFPSVHSETPLLHQNVEPTNFQAFPKSEQTTSAGVMENSPPPDEPGEDDVDQRSSGDPNVGGGQADDGYNWRKYGQKQVKGSEYPRSYYKCTHSNCPVKKKVERSHEGHITEIIYKGVHNHSKPNRRSTLESEGGLGMNGDLIWSTGSKGAIPGAPGWVQENLESRSSAPLVQEYGNGATFQAQHESGDGVDPSLTFSNDDDEDDRVTHGSVSLGYDGEGDELESKRRRIETYAAEMTGATRAIREPRVVVQTTSDVDILDDGYRWRKYGQKVVKGNPNPRSYYKCTSAGCNVRKHVERASHDLKSVITTYEGKHNHDVPAARNSSHANTGNSNGLPSQQPPAASTVSAHMHRPDALQIHSRFERPPLGPGFRFGTNHPGLVSLGLAGLGIHQGKLTALPVQQHQNQAAYLGQGRGMNGMGFVVPKAEPKMEPGTEMKTTNAGSTVYQQLMSQMALPPHM